MGSESIAIAGATGFVGRALGAALGSEAEVIGLARTPPAGGGHGFASWRRTDFLSLLDAERALEGIGIAYYLIHSMMPSASLTQGKFQDFDLIAADNFARSARKNGVKQIIYLGGLVEESANLSAHLESRLEVERALSAYGTPVTTLRAGMIVGRGGSSFVLVNRLVERLPVMICPRWTRTETQPIALSDIVALLKYCAGRTNLYSRQFDVGGPNVMTYERMMREIAVAKGRRLRIFRIPFFSPGLSRLWISLITGAPKSLVRPLVHSLRHRMVARDRVLQEMAGIPGVSFGECLRAAAQYPSGPEEEPVAFLGARRGAPAREVSSVQRVALPPNATATWVAEEYLRWLPQFLGFLVRVKVAKDHSCRFYLWRWRVPLLVLAYSKERSVPDRALFYIRGGLLARIQGRGRMEIREVPGKKCLLTAVLEFRPRLPWFIYRMTQAQVHRWVMWAFGRHLARVTTAQPNKSFLSHDATYRRAGLPSTRRTFPPS